MDYVAMSQEMGKHTGGIGATNLLVTKWGGGAAAASFIVRGKALVRKADKLLGLLHAILSDARLDNQERFRQIVLEEKAQAEAALIPAGHRLVNLRLLSRLNRADRMSERINGLEQLFFLRGLAARVDADWPGVLADLEAARAAVVDVSRAIVNVTLDRKDFDALRPAMERFVESLPRRSEGTAEAGKAQNAGKAHAPAMELLTAPSQVNFVGAAYPLAAAGARPSGAFLVAKKYLDTTFLWEKVRVQGGAYGGFSSYDLNSGTFAFLSYRDPNLEKTWDTFAEAAGYLKNLAIGDEELTRAIIGTIGAVDGYLLPDAKGFTSLVHFLTGYTQETRQAIRDQILAAKAADFRALGEAIAAAKPLAISGALASRQRVEALPASIKEGAIVTPVL